MSTHPKGLSALPLKPISYAAVLCVMLFGAPPAISAQETQHGALAVDRNNGYVYGFSYNHPTRAAAEQTALEEARKRGEGAGIVISWAGTGCAAYRSVDGKMGDAYGWGLAATQSEADAIASLEARKRSDGAPATNYVWACNSGAPSPLKIFKNEPVPDKFPSVTIGNQTWMTGNLAVTTFRDGTKIPRAKSIEDFAAMSNAGGPASYIAAEPSRAQHGVRFNWAAVANPKGICPTGWHVPSVAEWQTLFNVLGGETKARASMLKGGASGFEAELAGYENYDKYGEITEWWTTTPHKDPEYIMHAQLYYDAARFSERGPGARTFVRCLKD